MKLPRHEDFETLKTLTLSELTLSYIHESVEPFYVPWGSESICAWCKKGYSNCRVFTEKVDTIMGGIPVTVSMTELYLIAQIISCPIDEFEPDYSQNIINIEGRKIVPRYQR